MLLWIKFHKCGPLLEIHRNSQCFYLRRKVPEIFGDYKCFALRRKYHSRLAETRHFEICIFQLREIHGFAKFLITLFYIEHDPGTLKLFV